MLRHDFRIFYIEKPFIFYQFRDLKREVPHRLQVNTPEEWNERETTAED